MSRKDGGRGIGDVEREQRSTEDKRKREEHLGYAHIVSAIETIANQLAANEKAQDNSDRKRGFRERVTIGLVLVTFAAAGIGDWIFYGTMVDAGRAWLIPNKVTIVSATNAESGNKPGTAVFLFKNIGHSPATNFFFRAYLREMPIPKDMSFTHPPDMPENLTCKEVDGWDGYVPPSIVYPTTGDASEGDPILQDGPYSDCAKDGHCMLYVQGCLAYDTYRTKRHTGFCYFVIPFKGQSPDKWTPVPCSTGNWSD